MDLLVLEMSSVTLSFWYLSAMSLPIWRYRNPYYLYFIYFIGTFFFIYFATSLTLKDNVMKENAHKPLLLMKEGLLSNVLQSNYTISRVQRKSFLQLAIQAS